MQQVAGDATGLWLPADPQAFAAAGPDWLTGAFRAFGALGPAARVTAMTLSPCPGGSTGAKLFATLEYRGAADGVPRALFVKFSRDFADPVRDRARGELAAEVRFAEISRRPGFPIRVPRALFADYHAASGTGLLVTERIGFGEGGIEPHRPKCLDHETLDDVPGHYRALLAALARLAGADQAGRLAPDIAARFGRNTAPDAIRHDARQLRNRVARYGEFAAEFPQLLPADLREPAFVARLEAEVGEVLSAGPAIRRFLDADERLVALCHWNANIDNAWFWREPAGDIGCGLLDWGRVGRLNLGFALWGCLSGAGLEVWQGHFPALLAHFSGCLEEAGGHAIAPAELQRHVDLYVAMMGLAWLLDAPPLIRRALPRLAEATGPHDAMFRDSETARAQLHLLTVFLDLWRRHDLAARAREV